MNLRLYTALRKIAAEPQQLVHSKTVPGVSTNPTGLFTGVTRTFAPSTPFNKRWGASYKPFGGVSTDYTYNPKRGYEFRGVHVPTQTDTRTLQTSIDPTVLANLRTQFNSQTQTAGSSSSQPQNFDIPEINVPATRHVVQRGENPTLIAKKYNVPVSHIMNSYQGDPNRMQIGTVIDIPKYHRPGYNFVPNFYDAIVHIESSGDPLAEGDWDDVDQDHLSRGIVQIRRLPRREQAKYLQKIRRDHGNKYVPTYSPQIDDVNLRYNTTYQLDDRLDPVKAKDIFHKWSKMYAEDFYKMYNRYPAPVEFARAWNGGAGWMNKPKSDTEFWDTNNNYARVFEDALKMLDHKRK